MRADLETELRGRIAAGETPRAVIAALVDRGAIQNAKQAWRTLEKWAARNQYDYGVSLDLGWLK